MKVIIYRQQAHVETHEEDRGLRVRTLQVIKKKIKNRLRGALEEGQTVGSACQRNREEKEGKWERMREREKTP